MTTRTPARSLAPLPSTPGPAAHIPPTGTRDWAASSPARTPHPLLPDARPAASPALTSWDALARKASLEQLTSNSLRSRSDPSAGHATHTMAPLTPAQNQGGGAGEVEVGDMVDVPGAMHGTVRFIGSVKGKMGVFAGVELSKEYAARGKNDGDVEGTRYFTTIVPNSGIFLPLARASKRTSPTLSSGASPPAPATPSSAGFREGLGDVSIPHKGYTPPTPAVPKFSQSVGPGRAASPQFKPKSRPSLPRPESPLRRQHNVSFTPNGRTSLGTPAGSKNVSAAPRFAPSPTPGKFGTSLRGKRTSASNGLAGDPGKKSTLTPRPNVKTSGSSKRSDSGDYTQHEDFDSHNLSSNTARTSDGSRSSFSALNATNPIASGRNDEEVRRLKSKLEERDRQLKDQARSLSDMESNLIELQSLLPSDGGSLGRRRERSSASDEGDVSRLRVLLREKNEKIAQLTAEFDAHRADFRSTIDTLELASTETERVYEKRVEELLHEVRDLQDRSEDVESVARQLKQLEELVQELEEGLEDARRGEAEARGEVEFLRGEVERGRSELRRERDKAAAALKGAGAAVDRGGSPGGTKEVEQRDDEIRGLKAIIHSLSRDAVPDTGGQHVDGTARPTSQRKGSLPKTNGSDQRSSMQLTEERTFREKLERDVKELQGLVERKAYKEEELEREVERLRKGRTPGQRVSNSSERTVVQGRRASDRDSRGAPTLETMPESDSYSSDAEGSALWCEICETSGHDILTCTNMFGNPHGAHPQNFGHERQVLPHQLNGTAMSAFGTPNAPFTHRTGREVVAEGLKTLAVPPQRADDAIVSPPSREQPTVFPEPRPAPTAPLLNTVETGMVAGKATGVIDPDKWCALCERDGHESVDCPFEDAF
ncbi:MAG: hypothetical protein M1833_002476 [Piccolia ochrophora]|nr:MAG: hypothetical protein M1833_002476 [Piccolia ochrophora]